MTEHEIPSDDVKLEQNDFSMDATSSGNSETLPIRQMQPNLNAMNGSNPVHKATPISVAIDPVALITTECITVTSAMRKHARWAHSSVSAILGGSSSSPSSPGGFRASRPGTPRDDLANRRGRKDRGSSGGLDGSDDAGLINRWGLRGKRGKSMQDNPLMAGFGRLRRELTGCKGSGYPLRQRLGSITKFNRYSGIRYSLFASSISPGHPSLSHCCPNYLLISRSNNEVFRIQPNQRRLTTTSYCDAIAL